MPQFDKEKLREALPISKLLSYYGARKAKGSSSYHCPLHEDKKPSLVANDSRGVATCYSPKCSLKAGSDIFQIITSIDRCNFQKALEKASEIAALPVEFVYADGIYQSSENKDFTKIPETWDLEAKHINWLKSRFGVHYDFIVAYFGLRGNRYHIYAPITISDAVFIPLDKEKDQMFYRGLNRGCQVYPNEPERQREKKKVFVCEGEKDVWRVALEFYKTGVLDKWETITNTIGAGNIKEDTALFSNFNPDLVDEVIICYDNDEVGRKANNIVYKLAQSYFKDTTKIKVFSFPDDKPKGYDISDYLNERSKI